jgi:hypothetical protein
MAERDAHGHSKLINFIKNGQKNPNWQKHPGFVGNFVERMLKDQDLDQGRDKVCCITASEGL